MDGPIHCIRRSLFGRKEALKHGTDPRRSSEPAEQAAEGRFGRLGDDRGFVRSDVSVADSRSLRTTLVESANSESRLSG